MSQRKEVAKHISSLCSGRWTREYTKSKILTDPLYGGVYDELKSRDQALLDIGCGMGILAFYLRECDWKNPIVAFDFDSRKIEEGQRMAKQGNYADITLLQGDARVDLPAHSGDVTILDILQYLNVAEQQALLKIIADKVGPGGKLVIRSGLKMKNFRFYITWIVDQFAKLCFWMKSSPNHYPTEESIRNVLEGGGLTVEIRPFWGNTPFNNFLIVATREG